MVNKYFVILLAVVSLWACNNKKEEKQFMSEDDLVNILIDIHLTDASLSTKNIYTRKGEYKPSYYYNSIFEKHSISQPQFDSTIVYYSQDNAKFSQIYERVIDSLNRLETALKIEMKNEPESQDTVNLWNRKTELKLKGKFAQNLTFNIPIEELGFYTIKAEIKIDKSDESLNPKMVAHFWKLSDEKDDDNIDFETIPLVKDGKFHTYETKLELTDSTYRMLKGDFFLYGNEDRDFNQNVEIRNILIYNPKIRMQTRPQRLMKESIRD